MNTEVIMNHIPLVPPVFKTKTVEFIHLKPYADRIRAIENAGFNTFLLDSEDVYIDLLTDSGTSAMSDMQWAGLMIGDEAYAGSKSFKKLESAVQDCYGYPYIVPTHQGRGAEHIMAQILVSEEKRYVPNNLYFTTSRFHQEYAGGIWIDVSSVEASDPKSVFPFKGNIDIPKLKQVIQDVGAGAIAFVRIEASLNMAGGQPFSMENLKNVYALCKENGILLLLDATRISENAFFIKQREAGYESKTLKEIIKEICSYTDCCTMSSKKDHYVNIGGFLATHNERVFKKAREMVVLFEGLHTYGGMSGRDMEALAVGIRESLTEELIHQYTNQVLILGNLLEERGIPIVKPLGAHAVFIDAREFFDHIPQHQFPAQTLAAELYIEGGVRTMERGIVSGQHGTDPYDGLELVRVTLPRRVYNIEHLRFVAHTAERVWNKRKNVKGLTMVYEPGALRFFQARFKRVEP